VRKDAVSVIMVAEPEKKARGPKPLDALEAMLEKGVDQAQREKPASEAKDVIGGAMWEAAS
jgi:hypothetical protein